jgi:hypothetical protein
MIVFPEKYYLRLKRQLSLNTHTMHDIATRRFHCDGRKEGLVCPKHEVIANGRGSE